MLGRHRLGSRHGMPKWSRPKNASTGVIHSASAAGGVWAL
jgi:hypothetical protein